MKNIRDFLCRGITSLLITGMVWNAANATQVVQYNAAKHSEGIRTILAQTAPDGTSYSYLVGNPDYIIETALRDGHHVGHVLEHGNTVEGFVCCSVSNNRRYDSSEKFWYVDWLALSQKCQGQNKAKSLWDQAVHNATEKNLPIMLNTLKTNHSMQKWCTKMGIIDEGPKHPEGMLKYYTYRAHLDKTQENTQQPCKVTPKKQHLQHKFGICSWLYNHRYKLELFSWLTAGALLLTRISLNKKKAVIF
jgi:hypothetical protein